MQKKRTWVSAFKEDSSNHVTKLQKCIDTLEVQVGVLNAGNAAKEQSLLQAETTATLISLYKALADRVENIEQHCSSHTNELHASRIEIKQMHHKLDELLSETRLNRACVNPTSNWWWR